MTCWTVCCDPKSMRGFNGIRAVSIDGPEIALRLNCAIANGHKYLKPLLCTITGTQHDPAARQLPQLLEKGFCENITRSRSGNPKSKKSNLGQKYRCGFETSKNFNFRKLCEEKQIREMLVLFERSPYVATVLHDPSIPVLMMSYD